MDKNQNNGHRRRLRERFLKSGFDGFLDYEIIELLLTLSSPRIDCKPIAKKLIEKFDSVFNVLNASSDELEQVKGIGPTNSISIKIFKSLLNIYAEEKIDPKQILDNPRMVFEFLKEKIGKEKKEHFVILFLNTRNQLIYDEVSVGIVDASIVHPREVFRKALVYNASRVVLAHNHPSGDPTPSGQDIQTTKRLIEAGKIIGINVSDHIIIAANNYSSMNETKILK